MPNLPIHEHFDEITELLKKHQVIVVAGETGSGKSTQLPQLCYTLFSSGVAAPGEAKLIGHTQPRRIAAKTIATRIADEMKVSLGNLVGYQMRFNEAVSEQTVIKVMTDGILLAETNHDPLLKRYQALIIDEVHERSLNIDFILGYLKQILPRRPDLKIILTSATLDHERLAAQFNAPVVLVEGRSYPIEIRYQPLNNKGKDSGEALFNGVVTALMSLKQAPHADTLVFLPTERDIRDMRKRLAERFRRQEVLPLYARLPLPSQQKIFHPGNLPRIILATNVAETSITVPNVRYVIDSGLARVSRFNAKLKIQRLPIEAIAQANAKQRAGRAGRTAPGIAIRLYEEADLLNRPAFLEPELLRTNLSAVILLMFKLKLGNIQDFPFIDPPPRSLIHEGYQELLELQALHLTQHSRERPNDTTYTLSAIGKQMSDIPLDPRLGRMLVAAQHYRVLPEVLAIASNLTIQDPREYPEDQLGKATALHQRDAHPESEFLSILNLWQRVHQETQGFSHNRFKRYCFDNFLSQTRFREWQALYAELISHQAQATPHTPMSTEYNYQAIHQALLTGALHFIGFYDQEKQCYRGAHNKLFQVFPASSLAKKKFKWLMAESLMETKKVYARITARIEANWLEPISKHLVTYHYSEPFYDKQRDEVIARETVLLYGLPIITGRKTLFCKKDPKLAREIFIREAIVPQYTEAERTLLETWEAKLRRLGICFTDEEAFLFYDRTLPTDAFSFKTLHHDIPILDIRERVAGFKALEKCYPDFLEINQHKLLLVYKFEPGEKDDGVTLKIKLSQLASLPQVVEHPNQELQLQFLVTNEDGQGLARSSAIQALKQHFHDELNEIINTADHPFDDAIHTGWDFGDLPECVNHGIPALTKTGNGVTIRLYHDPLEAQAAQQRGVLSLLKQQFNKDLKALKTNPIVLQQLSQLSFIQDKTSLIDEFLEYSLRDFLSEHDCELTTIRTAAAFNQLLSLQGQFYHYQQGLQKWLKTLTDPLLKLRVQLKNLSRKQGLADSVADLQNQFFELCAPHFFAETPIIYLKRYPVYFKGMELRIQRLQHNPKRELSLFKELSNTLGSRLYAQDLTWIIQEYRLSLFAQELKTLMPISAKKIAELL